MKRNHAAFAILAACLNTPMAVAERAPTVVTGGPVKVLNAIAARGHEFAVAAVDRASSGPEMHTSEAPKTSPSQSDDGELPPATEEIHGTIDPWG